MMTELDLIPESYRRMLWRRSFLHICTAVIVATLLLGGAAALTLLKMTRSLEQERMVLQQERSISDQRSADFARLSDELAGLRAQQDTLLGLRGGAAAPDIIMTVDRALPDSGIWFKTWEFRRAGVVGAGTSQSIGASYFVMESDATDFDGSVVRVQTHMGIKGQAIDHGALSRFVRNLFAQPEIQDVRLLRTSSRRYFSTTMVDFDLAIVLRSTVEKE